MKIVIGTRGSQLALKQTEEVKKALLKEEPSLEIEIRTFKTKGDQNQTASISSLGSNGVFTSVIEQALLNNEIDLAVHSLKDLPSVLPEGLCLCSTIKAQDPRDCIIFKKGYHSLKELPLGATVATCSLRRKHAILKLRPDLKIVDIRGNIETRIKKLDTEDIDATILAVAGVNRLHLEDEIGEYLSIDEMIPSCCQGILGIETRKNAPVIPLIEKISDKSSTQRMRLERLFLTTLNGSCKDAIGCYIEVKQEGTHIHAMYGDAIKYTCMNEVITSNIETRIQEIAKELKSKINE